MPFLPRPHSFKHVGADGGVVDVCAYWHTAKQSHDVERERIPHGICNAEVTGDLWIEGTSYGPMNKSGMSFDMASHARYIEPRLCPRSVKRGHAESSTRCLELRNTKWTEFGER